jgi:hypothetical protein
VGRYQSEVEMPEALVLTVEQASVGGMTLKRTVTLEKEMSRRLEMR